jgi:hypothetical protein
MSENLLEYPNSLTFGLLSYECSTQTRKQPEYTSNLIQSAKFASLVRAFKTSSNQKLEENIIEQKLGLDNWKIHQVISDSQTGYFGKIYKNDLSQQIVLVHNSIDFKYGLFSLSGLRKNSGVREDIEGVMKANLTLYQAQAFSATKTVIDLIKDEKSKKNYSLSFSGHSLGAWLAQLSVFWCINRFEYEQVKAVTFDSPGALEMIEKLNGSPLSSDQIKQFELLIVNFLSAPNIVNCANRHIGSKYRLFPRVKEKIDSVTNERIENELIRKLVKFGLKKTPSSLTSLYGHSLNTILPYFDLFLGEPKDAVKMDLWPSIDFTYFISSKTKIKSDLDASMIESKIKSPHLKSTLSNIWQNKYFGKSVLEHQISNQQAYNFHPFLLN